MFEENNDQENDDQLIETIDATHARVSCAERELLALIAEVDRRESWQDSGARDTAHWLAMRYGISYWKATRWIVAAHALQGLPLISEALVRGDLGIDKVVELCRFATPRTSRSDPVGPDRLLRRDPPPGRPLPPGLQTGDR